jgi:pimeloyl-ACP methyl ester carboxylesterase
MRTDRRRVRTSEEFGGIELDIVDAGPAGGPVVVLAHGFPESSYSWRHQIQPLAESGWRVLVPDQRGYARSSVPHQIEAYRSDRIANDLVALIDDVGARDAVFVGHDWGALVVWDLARFHPTRVRGVVNVSVPYTPWPAPPTELFRTTYGDRFFYMLHFQRVGLAESELDTDVERSLRTILWAASGDLHQPPPPVEQLPAADETGFLDAFTHRRTIPEGLPTWLSPGDLGVYVDQFTASGFFGPVSWYRNLDADHELTKALPPPQVPCAFIGGTLDGVIADRPEYVESMRALLPDYRGSCMIEGAGHWTQQERPAEFDDCLLSSLDRINGPGRT